MDYKAYIYYNDIKICDIEYISYNKNDYKYIFRPYYNVIDHIYGFEGIMGLDLSLRKKEYIRRNILPSFIYERSPTHKRANFSELVDDRQNYTPLVWLCENNVKYFGDKLSIKK